jgi:hypothetical protein
MQIVTKKKPGYKSGLPLLIPNWVELGLKIFSYISFLNLSARVAVLIFSVDLYSPP